MLCLPVANKKERGNRMDYRTEIINLINKVDNPKLLRFIYYMLDDAVNRLFGESAGERH